MVLLLLNCIFQGLSSILRDLSWKCITESPYWKILILSTIWIDSLVYLIRDTIQSNGMISLPLSFIVDQLSCLIPANIPSKDLELTFYASWLFILPSLIIGLSSQSWWQPSIINLIVRVALICNSALTTSFTCEPLWTLVCSCNWLMIGNRAISAACNIFNIQSRVLLCTC